MTKKAQAKPKTYIGIDYGESNVGVALGKNELVHPLEIVSGKNPQYAAQQIAKIGIQNKVDVFVIGLPLTHDGKETVQSKKVRQFANLLKAISKKPVEYQEESDSSKEAIETAIELDIPQKSRRLKDHIAAGIILKRYFSSIKS
jgi:putative Holliday junction resolvase